MIPFSGKSFVCPVYWDRIWRRSRRSKLFIDSASSRDVSAWCILSTYACETDVVLGGLLERIYEYSSSAALHCFSFAETSPPRILRGFFSLGGRAAARFVFPTDEKSGNYSQVSSWRSIRMLPTDEEFGPLLIRILFAFDWASNIVLEAGYALPHRRPGAALKEDPASAFGLWH